MLKFIYLLVYCILINLKLFSQEAVLEVTEKYYRTNPFTQPFSNFISSLVYDSIITDKTIHPRTDSTLFFFKGKYWYFNPFGKYISRIEISLSEQELIFDDSIFVRDTILFYQLLAIADDNPKNQKQIQKEFEKIHQSVSGDFESDSTNYLRNNDTVSGIIRNYFYRYSSISPLTLAWGNIGKNEKALIITIRMLKQQNMAYIPSYYKPRDKKQL